MAESFGIKITKPGYDANNAGDADLIFNSGWPSLAIAYETSITSADDPLIVSHNLGFVPFTQAWVSDVALGGGFYEYFSPVVNNQQMNTPTSATSTNWNIKFYNLDLSTEAEYPFRQPSSTATTYNSDFGIKLAKENKSIDSTDMRDFILHSRCQSPLILAVKTESSASGQTVSYTDNQGFPLWVFGYVKRADGYYQNAPLYNPSYPALQLTTSGTINTYSITWTGTDVGATIVVLRDPMFAPTNLAVSY